MSDDTPTLEALEALLAAATPGPWGASSKGYAMGTAVETPIAGSNLRNRHYFAHGEDADLIVAAVNALPALLRVARAAHSAAVLGYGEESVPGSVFRPIVDALAELGL